MKTTWTVTINNVSITIHRMEPITKKCAIRIAKGLMP